jgi:hypothetical protein
MAEILIGGDSSPLSLRVMYRGEPAQPDAAPIVKVYDVTEDPAIYPAILPTQLLTTLSSELSEVDVGTYHCHLPVSYIQRQRSLKLVWQYDMDSQTITKEHKVFIVTPYTDLTQAAEILGVSTEPYDPGYKSIKELTNAERYARKTIESYTGQNFYLYDDVHVIYGGGSDTLPLPYKINALHELYVNGSLLLDTVNEIDNWNKVVEITESGYGIRVNRSATLDSIVYTTNGMVPPSVNDTSAGSFINGYEYRVQGKFGWDSVPDDIELACIELMKDYFAKDRAWNNKYVKRIQTFDWNFEYDTTAHKGTGNKYVDQLLDPYVLTQMVVV